MSGIEGGDDGERDNGLEENIELELTDVEAILKDLEAMLPAVQEDIAHIQANIDRVREQLAILDAHAEAQRESGELTEDMEISRSIGKAMNDIENGLTRLIQDKEVVLSTRMSVENAIEDLRDTREELEARFPENSKH